MSFNRTGKISSVALVFIVLIITIGIVSCVKYIATGEGDNSPGVFSKEVEIEKTKQMELENEKIRLELELKKVADTQPANEGKKEND